MLPEYLYRPQPRLLEAVECDLAVQHGSRDHIRETMIGRLSRLGRPLFVVSCGTSVCEIGRVERDGRDLPRSPISLAISAAAKMAVCIAPCAG